MKRIQLIADRSGPLRMSGIAVQEPNLQVGSFIGITTRRIAMKMLTSSAIAAAIALSGASLSAGSALADKVVIKKETAVRTQARPATGVVVVNPLVPGVAVVPTYRSNINDNCKKTVTKVNRPGNRPDTKTVKTNC
jgi:hypothetical protein